MLLTKNIALAFFYRMLPWVHISCHTMSIRVRLTDMESKRMCVLRGPSPSFPRRLRLRGNLYKGDITELYSPLLARSC